MQQAARHRGAPLTTKTLPTTTTTTTIVETLDPFPYSTVHTNHSNSSSSFLLPVINMSNGRDRTGEFQTTVKTFASRRVRSVS